MALFGDFSLQSPLSALDFRSSSDDAWYGVNLILDGEVLTVKYVNFSEEFDERVGAEKFNSTEELDNFRERFRPTSIQLQDSECRRVIEGMTVCASSVFAENDVRFYDAVVEKVCFSTHEFCKGEELCKCTFVLFWQHGPKAGSKTSTQIEHICLLQSRNAQINPTLDCFLKITVMKLKLCQLNSSVLSEHGSSKSSSTCCSETSSSVGDPEYSPSGCRTQACYSEDLENPKLPKGSVTASKGKNATCLLKRQRNEDLLSDDFSKRHHEAMSSCHVILIENLEKDLSPLVIVDFIYRQTSVSCQAYVLPSLSTEAYTRGTIFLESQENLKKVSGFLHNPSHLITSSKGRPWVIIEKKWRPGSYGAKFGVLMLEPKEKKLRKGEEFSSKIELVFKGTKEYEKGKRLGALFIEFQEHLERLHKRLASEERMILLPL